MKKLLSILLSFAMVISAVCTSYISSLAAQNEELQANLTDTSDFSLSSIALTQKMLVGYNIGDCFEAAETRSFYKRPTDISDFVSYKETLWGNVPVTEEYIKYLKSIGIQAIRLPVTWYTMLEYPEGTITAQSVWNGSVTAKQEVWYNGTINAAFLARIKQVVDWIISNDMYCIINTHHDGGCNKANSTLPLVFDAAHKDQSINYITNIWSQVGEYFKDYGSKLIFEAFNEVADSTGQMTPNTDRDAIASDVLVSFINTIRSQSGNNANRFLVCPRYGGVTLWDSIPFASSDTAQDKLIITTHTYSQASGMSGAIKNAASKETSLGIGCIIDEIGDAASPPSANSGAAPAAVRKYSDEYKVSCFWWDNGQVEFGLVNRYYSKPVSAVALGAYVGKVLADDDFTDPSQMIDATHPYYAKFYSASSNSNWGGKYIIVCSQKKISHYEKYMSRVTQGYYSLFGVDDAYITYYTSDDDVHYRRMITRYAALFSRLAYNDISIYGSTQDMVQTGGNYAIGTGGGTFYAYDYTPTISGTGDSLYTAGSYGYNTTKWGYINFKGIQNTTSGLAQGDYFEMDIKNLESGIYNMNLGYIGGGGTATSIVGNKMPFKVSIVGENGNVTDIKNVTNVSNPTEESLGSYTQNSSTNIKIRFTATTTNTAYKYIFIYFITFTKTADVTTTATTAVTTAPTTAAPTETTTEPATQTTTEVVKLGDANSDGYINSKDTLLIRQHCAEWDVVLSVANADLNSDGYINSKDVLLLRKIIAEWDIL